MSTGGPAARHPRGKGPGGSPWHVWPLRRIRSPTSRRGLKGKGAQDPPSSVAPGTGQAPQSLLRCPSGGLNPAAGPNLGSSVPPPHRAQSRTRPPAAGSIRLCSSSPCQGAARRPAAGAPPRGARNTAPGLDSPGSRPSSPPRRTASSHTDSAPLLPPGPILSGAPPSVRFLPVFQPLVLQYPQTHKGSLRLSLRVRHGLAFWADDRGVQSKLGILF
ncbi:hypothetical protein NDU88_003628 [Pleurodeles waltl]|uniref:Uncharacterized protein n=1 Tax=Pleurodeles waltl TaxID=8319 RepID=A0AAV7RFN0_PLEWA|nr:hypothetical protein NDU88_003628 [Pleurodeles waltl]